MDDQKKQKMLLVGLAVLALGAGGYYFVLREPASSRARATNAAPLQRRVRAPKPETEQREKKTARKKRGREKTGIEGLVTKRVRKKDDSKKVERRTRRGGKRTKTKKKELAPFG